MLVNLYLFVKLFVWLCKAVMYTIVVAVVAVFTLGYAAFFGIAALYYLAKASHYRKAASVSGPEEYESPAKYSNRR